jgi:predicted ATPase
MITRVSVHNYKSLADVDVSLGPLTVLVGQNGTGKSNFVDVLHFISDAVYELDQAIVDRGGMSAIRRYSPKGRPYDVAFSLTFKFGDEEGEFAFGLTGKRRGEYEIKFEKCSLAGVGYEVRGGEFAGSDEGPTFPIDPTMLVLRLIPPGHPVWPINRFLRDTVHYTIFPNDLRDPRKPYPMVQLMEDGFNIGSVLRRMKKSNQTAFRDLTNSLTSAVPGVVDIDVKQVSGFLVVSLRYEFDGHTSAFNLSQESDGTLRLLGILTALYQDPPPSLITIEEPELTVHPGALGVLYDVIKEASLRSQIIITTHSPDLISLFSPEELRVVDKVGGMTEISPLGERQVEIINKRLFSAGDLLRIEGLERQSSH